MPPARNVVDTGPRGLILKTDGQIKTVRAGIAGELAAKKVVTNQSIEGLEVAKQHGAITEATKPADAIAELQEISAKAERLNREFKGFWVGLWTRPSERVEPIVAFIREVQEKHRSAFFH